jgi:hypothetical protein
LSFFDENTHETSANIWNTLTNEQVFLPIVQLVESRRLHKDAHHRLPVNSALLLAVRSCDQISGPPTSVPYVGGFDKIDKRSTGGEFSTRDLGLAFCWFGVTHLALLPPSTMTRHETEMANRREVQGDGTFIVLFGEYEYVVWSLGEYVPLVTDYTR